MNSVLIESENLVALKNLLPQLKGKVDVMPIDPPYNTAIDYVGYKDNNFDGGWMQFMRQRLEAAYPLLSDKGVMFINIDENEFCNLYLLCVKIFGVQNIMSMVWKKVNERFDKNRKEKPLEAGIRRTHEFILVCFKDRAKTTLNPIMQPVWNGEGYVEELKPLESIVDDMGTNSSAKDELAEILGDRNLFQTPKPVKMIKEFIRSASDKNSIVMDFFAGSGTTGQAVLELNAEDGGNRKFILITNSENNICKRVTLPRLKAVSDKFSAEFEYKNLY